MANCDGTCGRCLRWRAFVEVGGTGDHWIVCDGCGGPGCEYCGREGVIPAWYGDPEVTGHDHERPDLDSPEPPLILSDLPPREAFRYTR